MGLASLVYKKIDQISKNVRYFQKKYKNKLPHVEVEQIGSFTKLTLVGIGQSRSYSTAKIVLDALKDVKTEKNFLLRFYITDKPDEHISDLDFYYCLTSETRKDFLMPDFAFDGWPEAGITSFTDTTHQIQLAGLNPYIDGRIFWIGNVKTNPIRQKLLELGNSNTDKFIFKNTFVDDFIIHKHEVPYASLPDHCKYKYLIDVEGNSYSARLKFLFYSRRVVFIQEREWKEYFHYDLKPYIHFIPVKNDLSDLISQYEMMESRPELYQEIVDNAYNFATTKLTYNAAIEFMTDNIMKRLNNEK